ncbi:hypothetical protein DLM_0013 [Aquitalea magnusonii]|uniref:Uncharacterized protein n=1 Tax=Aquitalea magnusonii TaxID=332411 RepID=A0A3G9GBU7_9NEIS|nr:hypothetical protein [Aquitalea magnusonii]BBF83701.1 hypothetical protein DLM_0013 [Aquitalea magnusonii]
MDAIDILGLMQTHPPAEPVSLSAIPLMLAQAVAAITGKITVDELGRLVAVGAALCAHEQDLQFRSVEADLLVKQLSDPA